MDEELKVTITLDEYVSLIEDSTMFRALLSVLEETAQLPWKDARYMTYSGEAISHIFKACRPTLYRVRFAELKNAKEEA